MPPIVQLVDIRPFLGDTEDGDSRTFSAREGLHLLLVATENFGLIVTDGSPLFLTRGMGLILPPGSRVTCKANAPNDRPIGYRAEFQVERDEAGLFAASAEIRIEAISRLEAELRELSSLGRLKKDDGLADFHRHIRFQSVLYELLSLRLADNGKPDARPAVENSIAYLHQVYSEEIEFDRLAQEANMSRWQYDRMFKSLTGQSPARYLSSIRIDEAKRLLAAPSSRVGEIASRVGFRDEFYFSRRFRQSTGQSPSEYAQMARGASRIFSIQYLGELLALGIRPVGTNSAMFTALPEAAGVVKGVDEPFDDRLLGQLRPDLILYPSFMPKQDAKKLSRIATAIEIDWSADVYTRMLSLGKLLGKHSEAEYWIASYEKKAKNARQLLRGIAGDGETATAFVYHAGDLYVYAGHHFGHTLYRGIGFIPPPPVQAIMEENRNAKWVRIDPSELEEYAGDRVFLALPDNGLEGENGRKLLRHSGWNGLPAVSGGRAYVMSDTWANYNPITLEKHLDETVYRLLNDRRF